MKQIMQKQKENNTFRPKINRYRKQAKPAQDPKGFREQVERYQKAREMKHQIIEERNK